MKKRNSLRIAVCTVLLSISMLSFACVSAGAANSIKSTFWNSTQLFTEEHLFIFSAKNQSAYDKLTNAAGNSSSIFTEALASASVKSKVSGVNTTMIIKPSKNTDAYYTGFLMSEGLNSQFLRSGGKTIRLAVDGIAVERSASRYPDAMNLTDILASDSELRGSVCGAWSVRSVSTDKSGNLSIDHPFVLRFELSGKYKADDIQLVTASNDGSIEVVDSKLSISKSGNTYYARTEELYSGIYCIIKK